MNRQKKTVLNFMNKFLVILYGYSLLNVGCTAIPVAQSLNAQTSIIRKKPLSIQDTAAFCANVAERIAQDYVEPVDNHHLLEGALNGMLQSLDPHSAYLDPVKFFEIQKQTQGQYGGLGMEITMEEGLVKVISPIEDTPAYKADLKTGDLIVLIDNEPVYGLSIIEASNKMKGEPGTKVQLGIRRHNVAPFELELVREQIKVQPVKWRTEGNVGYLRITTFNEHTTKELKKAIVHLQKQLGPQLKGLLIDVRGNAGGLLDQAVEVTDLFLNSGTIVAIRGRDPAKDYVFKANTGDMVQGIPIVVLINGGSASASEILAGGLQDNKRALIVGTLSFGKGTVQTVIPMTNGGALKLTTAHYYTPSGRSIQKKGIEPDVVIEQQVDLKTINEDKRYREANLHKALGQGKGASQKEHMKDKSDALNDKTVQKISTVSPTEKVIHPKDNSADKQVSHDQNDFLKDVSDYQLVQALNILKTLIISKNQ